uniref:L-type lectin-domain containing receptor kinase I.7 n=1 Tax=Zeugodacus cucurbitae TaxID=28588 RepID=A0A0A1XDT2_ZEUCU
MAPNKTDFDLTDRGWVDLYVKKCENIMKEFTEYVYALQNHCLKEHSKIVDLDKHCKQLKTKLVEEKQKQKPQDVKGATLYAPLAPSPINNDILSVTRISTPSKADADRTTISDGSPAFLNMAMDSEQLNMESSCVLSPAQHRQDIFSSSEQLSSPNRSSIAIDSALQHNTSPTCKLKSSNENKSALGFLKARGRVGKTLYNDTYEHKLREQNPTANENEREMLRNKAKLQAKRSDWIGKDKKSEERKAGLKRSASNLDEVLRKRSMMSLSKSGERKLKQSRLTQMVSMKSFKAQNDSISTSPADVSDAQIFAFSPTAATTIQRKLDFPTFSNDTDDIFQFSSDDDDVDEQSVKKTTVNSAIKQNIKKSYDTTFFQPNETDKTESVLAITPTAPPLICIDDSDDNEHGTVSRVHFGKLTTAQQAAQKPTKATSVIVKKEKSGTENLATELAAAMLAEWEEEEPDHEDIKAETPQTTAKHKAKAVDVKPRLSQLPAAKISIKERYNIDCDECQKYIDFMGSNMSLSDIEAHLRRCTLHRTAKDDLPTTPPNYWNPLMPSFSENDPRNKTLLEDPYIQRKRGSNKL